MTIETKENGANEGSLGITQTIASDLIDQQYEKRYQRVQRGTKSSQWLIANAREKANLDIQPNHKITSKDADWVKPPRPANCGATIGNLINVHLTKNTGNGQTAYFKGVQRCGSLWACPRCSAAKRTKYAIELDNAYTAIMEADDLNPGLFLTLSLRHSKDVPLKTSLSTLQGAFSKMRVQNGWRRLMATLGKQALIRSTEITYSYNNGWHPHLHIWLITDKPVSRAARANAETEISNWWQAAVAKYSGVAAFVPNNRGCDLRLVDSRGIAAYVQKIQEIDNDPGERRRLSNELVRGDLKTARSRSSIVPFELLDKPDGKNLWIEYVETTKGRRALDWTKGFKKRLGINKKPAPKSEDGCGASDTTRVFSISADNYNQNRTNPKWVADVLTITELNAYVAATKYGKTPPVPVKTKMRVSGSICDFMPTTGNLRGFSHLLNLELLGFWYALGLWDGGDWRSG